ncbi:MAG: type II toxin-antitoxin system RelE/ParE family toxin [Deltaproteobacteria bacterium]|nr:type II toxin-antitoxin system RelE/ParE family toxin [Deltaproteobacteria bacterium]
MWTVMLSPQAQKFYGRLTGKHQVQMASAFDVLQQDPHTGKPLRGDLKGYWSYRVGVYRMIYSIRYQEVLVDILRIQHRKEVYERFGGG